MSCLVFRPDSETPELVDCLPMAETLPEGTYAYRSGESSPLRWVFVETLVGKRSLHRKAIYRDWSAVEASQVPDKLRAYAMMIMP